VASAIEHVYRYVGASELADEGGRPTLRLCSSGGTSERPAFFRGRLTEPRRTSVALRALSRVVGTRFYTPPAMLASILRAADPVVTSGGGVLRFEGFSACASVHVRVDLEPDAYDGEIVGHGTTNVDFGAAMRAALSAVSALDTVGLSVGVEGVRLESGAAVVTERKVPLPLRWLKGFVEVLAYQARMRPRWELSGAEALRFLRGLPRTSTSRHAQWVVPSGRGLRLSMTPSREGLRITASERLRVLEELAPSARSLLVFGDEAGEASTWMLDLGSQRLSLTLSAEVFRGFSGEGQALATLARAEGLALVPQVRAQLAWQAAIDPDALASLHAVDRAEVDAALLRLGVHGLVGFDAKRAAFFHRELPYDLDAIADLHPRLAGARKLVESGEIRFEEVVGSEGERVALVPGSGVVHRVGWRADRARCSCAWFAKYEGARGPCKHVLAVEMIVDEEPRS
jgi:hypothetical protein